MAEPSTVVRLPIEVMPMNVHQFTARDDERVFAEAWPPYAISDELLGYGGERTGFDTLSVEDRFTQHGSLPDDLPGAFDGVDAVAERSHVVAVPFCVKLSIEKESEAASFTLKLRGHSLGFRRPTQAGDPLYEQGKASVRLNGGPWVDLSNWAHEQGDIRIEDHAMQYGGIGGGFHTTRVTISAEQLGASMSIGDQRCNNTLEFRFNGTDGLSSGYRIVNLGIDDLREQSLFEAGAVVVDDPEQWRPPSASAESRERGRWLFYRRNILRDSPLKPERIRAACADCHAHDGRDLQYYAYSNRSIISRSIFHGLSEAQARDIASYIRSLGSRVRPYGRPWNPPFQPGPDVDSRTEARDRWAAGAGTQAVLDGEGDQQGIMARQLFRPGPDERLSSQDVEKWLAGFDLPSLEASVFGRDGGVSEDVERNLARAASMTASDVADLEALAGLRVERDRGTLNMREIPVALQLPDWNHWLPIVHPLDAFGAVDAAALTGFRKPLFNEDEFLEDLALQYGIPRCNNEPPGTDCFQRASFRALSREDRKAYLADSSWARLDYRYDSVSTPVEARAAAGWDGNVALGGALEFSDSEPWAALWQAHEALRKSAEVGYADLSPAHSGEALWQTAREYVQVGQVGRGSAYRTHFSPALALAEGNGVPKELAKRSLVLWLMVKHWELIREHRLEDRSRQIHPYGEPLEWPVGRAQTGHQPAPHIVASNEENFRAEGVFDQDPLVGLYESNSWYHLQLVLNSGARAATTGKPVDWIYYYQHTHRLSQRLAEAARPGYERYLEPLRYLATIVKGAQMRDNGLGPVDDGWRLRYVSPWRFVTSDQAATYASDPHNLLAQVDDVVPAGMLPRGTSLHTLITAAYVKYFTYKAQLFSVNRDRGGPEHPLAWRFEDELGGCKRWVCLPRTAGEDAPHGTPLFLGDHHGDHFLRIQRLLESLDVDPGVRNNFARWRGHVWAGD